MKALGARVLFAALLDAAYHYAPPFIAVATAFLAGKLTWNLIPTPAPVRAIERVTGERKEDAGSVPLSLPGMGRLSRLMPVSAALRSDLALLQALGRFSSLTVEDLTMMRLAGMVIGFLFVLLGHPVALMAGLVLMVIGYLSPDMWLRGQADKERRAIFRELPDAAENLAFLVGLGRPVNEALRNMAEGDTAFARLLRTGIARTPPGASTVDFMASWVAPFRIPALTQLFRRLADVARRGVGERALLGDLATSVATQYEADLLTRAEQLDNSFTPVMGVFFLLPYIALIMLPWVIAVARVFLGL